MALKLSGVKIDKHKIQTLNGQYGEFNLQTIVVEGQEFSRPFKEGRDKEVAQGDVIDLTYEKIQGKKGVKNRILDIQKAYWEAVPITQGINKEQEATTLEDVLVSINNGLKEIKEMLKKQ